MTQTKLFTNLITLSASQTQAHDLIANPTQLLKWVPEITQVNPQEKTFVVNRSEGALNHYEEITVEDDDSQVVYHSRKGRLAYDLVFELKSVATQVQIQESLMVDEQSTQLPIKLLAPIAKHAFNLNLANLGRLIEGSVMNN
jgi:hypothetical protein